MVAITEVQALAGSITCTFNVAAGLILRIMMEELLKGEVVLFMKRKTVPLLSPVLN
jgi:hypothetical protein